VLNKLSNLKLSYFREIYLQTLDRHIQVVSPSKLGLIIVNGAFNSGKSRFSEKLSLFGREAQLPKLLLLRFGLA